MTKLLDHAIAKMRQMPDGDQDTAAVVLLVMSDLELEPLDDLARAAIRRGLEQARRGESVADAEIDALWKQHGL